MVEEYHRWQCHCEIYICEEKRIRFDRYENDSMIFACRLKLFFWKYWRTIENRILLTICTTELVLQQNSIKNKLYEDYMYTCKSLSRREMFILSSEFQQYWLVISTVLHLILQPNFFPRILWWFDNYVSWVKNYIQINA